MIAFSIDYKVRGKDQLHSVLIDARDIKSAKRKLGRKHGYKDGRMIQVKKSIIVGYL
jgi:hypothetical protein